MLEPAFRITDHESLTDQHFIAPEEVAAKLEKLYADPGYRGRVAERCHARALDPAYRWSAISAQWAELFSRCLARA
jgi:glycosyltransferase involved in cell wall biosynthesis